MSTAAARRLAPMILAARRRPVKRTIMDWAVGAVRRDLVVADEEFFRAAATQFERWGSGGIERVTYPPLAVTGFGEAMITGWRAGQQRLDTMLRAWSRHVRREAGVRGPDHLTSLVLEAEHIIVPKESIARYVATRIPPLKYDVEIARRRLCRDIVAETAREGLGVRPTMDRLKRDGFGRSAWHRETIARTEGAHLYNHGQVARNRASGAVKGYRFSAIIDARTTEQCAALNGRSFKAEDISGVCPPLHFSCRSDLIPILFDEDPSWTTASDVRDWPEERQPMRGFGKIDLTQMPTREANVGDFLRPLRASEHKDVQAVVGLIERKLGALPKLLPKPEVPAIVPFTPKETRKKIIEWAKVKYPQIEVKFSRNMPIETANQVMAEMDRMLSRYPLINTRLRVLKSANLGSSTYAKAKHFPRHEQIELNSRWFNKPTVFTDSLAADMKSGWHPADGVKTESILTHELGHTLRHALSGDDLAAVRGWMFDYRDGAKSVSGYAARNGEELFAEAVTSIEITPRSQWAEPVKQLEKLLRDRGIMKP